MSLTQALSTAVSGLRAAQAGMSVVAANVANSETPGYVRKTAVQVTTAAGDLGVSVRIDAINRELDQYVQRQLRVEMSGAAYASVRTQFYERLQSVYGVPGSDSTLESVFNKFTSALQTLSASPDSLSARSAVVSAAQVLAQQLNTMTSDIQSLRSDAELGLADSVAKTNDAMLRIAQINQQLATTDRNDATTAALLDQRDSYVDQLSQLMDVRVVQNDHSQITVFTTSGVQLVGTQAAHLAFDAQGTMTATAQWNADPSKRSVGTIVLSAPNGGDVDLVATGSIRSGTIAGYLEMRDQVLVQAQSQLDEIAAALARSLSDSNVAGTAASAGAQTGFDVDVGSLLPGNVIHLTYTDNNTGIQHNFSIVRVDDPSALPLSKSATTDPNDEVIGIDFSGGMASVVSQLNGAFGSAALQFSNPSGTTLRVLDDGAANGVDVDALSTTVTATSLTGGSAALPFFVDANAPYSGSISGFAKQSLGLAGRINVNEVLAADPSGLVVYQTSPLTPAGDSTRPDFIYQQVTGASLMFSPQSGIGAANAPFTGSLPSFMRQVVSQQGEAADAAASLKAGQDVVFNALQQRFNDGASVNIDEEMSNLLNLQNSYAANARVLTTIRDMLDFLMKL